MSLTRGSAAPTPTMVASSSAQYSPKWPIFWAEFFFCSFCKKQNHFFCPFFKEAKKSISTGFCTQRQKILKFYKILWSLTRGNAALTHATLPIRAKWVCPISHICPLVAKKHNFSFFVCRSCIQKKRPFKTLPGCR